MIFGSVEGVISKSVAQFFALVFAYIMLPVKPVIDIFSRFLGFAHGSYIDGAKVPKNRLKSEFSRHLNPLNQAEAPYEPPC